MIGTSLSITGEDDEEMEQEEVLAPTKKMEPKGLSGGGLMGCMENKKNSQGSTEGSTADSYSSGKKVDNGTNEESKVIELD